MSRNCRLQAATLSAGLSRYKDRVVQRGGCRVAPRNCHHSQPQVIQFKGKSAGKVRAIHVEVPLAPSKGGVTVPRPYASVHSVPNVVFRRTMSASGPCPRSCPWPEDRRRLGPAGGDLRWLDVSLAIAAALMWDGSLALIVVVTAVPRGRVHFRLALSHFSGCASERRISFVVSGAGRRGRASPRLAQMRDRQPQGPPHVATAPQGQRVCTLRGVSQIARPVTRLDRTARDQS